MLGTFDEVTTPSPDTIGNGTDYVVDGKPTIAFVENVVDNLAGKFISKVIQCLAPFFESHKMLCICK